MNIIETGFEGLYEIEPVVHGDARGYFFESFRKDKLAEVGINLDFVQDNESYSGKGTIRGFHYQALPHGQAKLVRVNSGKVMDVVIDLRPDSKTYGEHYATVLDANRHNQLYIPVGFAHGFEALEDSIFAYKCSAYYHRESEGGILWSDPHLEVQWHSQSPIVSEKDRFLPTFTDYKKSPVF